MQNLMGNLKSLQNADIPFRTGDIHYYVAIGVMCDLMVYFAGPSNHIYIKYMVITQLHGN